MIGGVVLTDEDTSISEQRDTFYSGENVLSFVRKPLNLLSIALFVVIYVYMVRYIYFNGQLMVDDAYIHMRIAKHFSMYGVPYYNIDQAVAGSSSVLWLVLLSVAFRIFGTTSFVALAITLVCMLIVFAITTGLLARIYHPIVAVTLASVLLVLHLLSVAAELMETPLAICFWLASYLCAQRKQWLRAGLLAGLAFATRYEFVLWLALLFCAPSLWRERWRLSAGIIAPCLAVALFNMWFFGTLLPNTVRAKSMIYTLTLEQSLKTADMFLDLPMIIAILIINVLLAYVLFFRFKQSLAALGLLFGTMLFGLYLARHSYIFSWYVPLFMFTMLFCYFWIASLHNRWIRLTVATLSLFLSFLPTVIAVHEAQGVLSNQPQTYQDYIMGLRVQQYIRVAQSLAERYPHATLMAPEIGGIGWGFDGQIIDAVGLVSPEVLRYHPMPFPEQRAHGGLGAIPPQAVSDLKPDLIVTLDLFSQALQKAIADGQLPDYLLQESYPAITSNDPADLQRSDDTGLGMIRVFVRRDL